jgi:thiamine biosynthesis lipoprotein
MKRNPTSAIAVSGIVLVLLAVLLYKNVTTHGPVEVDSGQRVVMGTFSRIVVITKDERAARECIMAAFAEQDRIESLMSYYRDDSQLAQINREAAVRPVQVDERVIEVLEQARRFSELSDGVFDVTVGPLMDLWRAAGEANEPPTEAQLAAARAKVGWQKVILDPNARTVRLGAEGMRIDLGGIAKGYAVDKSVEVMTHKGALGGMVDLGGNIRCFGQTPAGWSHWTIAIQDPNVSPEDMEMGTPPAILQIRDSSISTSGHYRRFVTVAGHKQSHIVDPRNGHDNEKLASVTIITTDATSADALSTAVSILGLQKGMELVEKLPNTEAILIRAGDLAHPILSTGAGAYIR